MLKPQERNYNRKPLLYFWSSLTIFGVILMNMNLTDSSTTGGLLHIHTQVHKDLPESVTLLGVNVPIVDPQELQT
jgi:hypothetical protein